MHIEQPVGAVLPACQLPGGSWVTTKVVESGDGMPSLELTGVYQPIEISISDLEAICAWATRS